MLDKKIKYFNNLHEKFSIKFPKSRWDKDIQQKLMLDFSFYSNKIEGLKLNYGDTVEYLNTGLIHASESLKKLEELKNHHILLETIFQAFDTTVLDEQCLKKLNLGLLASDLTKEMDVLKMPGEYRDSEAFGIRKNKDMKTYCHPFEIKKEMESLLNRFKENIKNENVDNEDTHPINNPAYFHNTFLNFIHPFADGNGRACRLFMNIFLLQRNYPLLIIKDKDDYIETIINSENQNSNFPVMSLFMDSLTQKMEEIV